MVLLLTESGGSSGSSNTSTLQVDTPADPAPPVTLKDFCHWKDCPLQREPLLNILDHIQTTHVFPQTKAEGYTCLWEGCKVYSKKSSSLSWIERHVLNHGGTKPFGCIFPGCGLSFGSQGALERHVNSHISTNGSTPHSNGLPVARKVDSSPSKSARRKKQKGKKQKLHTGQFVDYFDKRTIEVIKYRLARAVNIEEENTHNCTFNCQVLSRRVCPHEEPHLLIRWYPPYILPDEWIPQCKFVQTKSIPFRQLPPDKLSLLFPQMFPPERREKAKRKWKPKQTSASENKEIMKCVKSEDSKYDSRRDLQLDYDRLCECCNCNIFPNGCKCLPLEPDWVEFLTEQYLPQS